MKHRVCVLNLTVGCWPLCLEGLAGVLSPRVTIVRKHLPLQLQCCKELEISHLWKIQCKYCACVSSQRLRACVRARAGWADRVCRVVIPVFSSPAEHTMHEYTHSHFTFRTLIHYSDGGQGTRIDYTDFFCTRKKESKKCGAQLCR